MNSAKSLKNYFNLSGYLGDEEHNEMVERDMSIFWLAQKVQINEACEWLCDNTSLPDYVVSKFRAAMELYNNNIVA